jgi:hypothetical protein
MRPFAPCFEGLAASPHLYLLSKDALLLSVRTLFRETMFLIST